MGEAPDPDTTDQDKPVIRQDTPSMPYPGALDQRLITPSAPLPPGAAIRVYPQGLMPPADTSHPPTWAPDPTGRHQWRWWCGVAWTDHVADDGVAGEDPFETPSATPSETPPGTP